MDKALLLPESGIDNLEETICGCHYHGQNSDSRWPSSSRIPMLGGFG